MMGGQWRASAAAGDVMEWMPTQMAIPTTREPPVDAMMSRMSISRESEDHQMRQPLAPLSRNTVAYTRNDSPTTLCASDYKVVSTPASSASSPNEDWLDQLQWSSQNDKHSERHTPSSSEASPNLSRYVSDLTDYLVDDTTPCPKRTANVHHQANVASNHRSRPKGKSVARVLDFGQSKVKKRATKQDTQQPSSRHKQALDDLKRVEYSPHHNWTDAQRRSLVILYRFYDANAATLTEVFNKMEGLDLRTNLLPAMYNTLRKHNGQKYPIYGHVFACPVNDPNDEYLTERNNIERTAIALGVNLERRCVETPNSAYARRRFKKMGEKLRKEARFDNDMLHQPNNPAAVRLRLGGIAITEARVEEIETEVEMDEDEIDTPIATMEEGFSSSTNSPRGRPQQLAHLGFRVWDRSSRTSFSPEVGFVSQMHSIWNGVLLPPPNLATEDGRNTHLLLTNLHLNKKSNASAYVSVGTSLIQVLNYASNMIDLQIAVIDTSHPVLQEPNMKLKAFEVLRELKGIGQAQWARYRGWAEIMIFGSVPIETILFHGPLIDVAQRVTAEHAGSLLFNPQDFVPDQTVSALTQKIKDRNITLDITVARACALFAKAMGLAGTGANSQHIAEFVQVCVDGWNFQITDDSHTRLSIASSFAFELAHKALSIKESTAAFIEGLEKGRYNIEWYQQRTRPNDRRRRTA